jgi:hypothetical protein
MQPVHVNLRVTARYIIYSLLALNIIWFFKAEFAASPELLGATPGLTELFTVFSETFDTLAWVLLILLFELEISYLPAERLRGGLKWLLSGLRAVCYVAIIFSLYGYWSLWQTVTALEPASNLDACALADQGYRYLAGLDDYPALTPANCGLLANQPLAYISGTRIVGSIDQLRLAEVAAIVDLVNAVTWLVVVIIMEAEIYMQLLGGGGERRLRISKYLLVPLYVVLLACTLYWLLYSDLLDFWDALLWLIAFAFIELNILDWQTGKQRPLAGSE